METIEFISSPSGKGAPLVQEILKLKPDNLEKKESLEIIFSDPIDPYNNEILYRQLSKEFMHFPRLVLFPEQYKNYFAYSLSYFNLNNPVIRCFVQTCLELLDLIKKDKLPKKIAGNILDMINDLIYKMKLMQINLYDLNANLNKIFKQAVENGMIQNYKDLSSEIRIKDFIKNSISVHKEDNNGLRRPHNILIMRGNTQWGELIK